jgi:hypothetical protein
MATGIKKRRIRTVRIKILNPLVLESSPIFFIVRSL